MCKISYRLPRTETRRDAWNALRSGVGLTPEQVYADLKKKDNVKQDGAEKQLREEISNTGKGDDISQKWTEIKTREEAVKAISGMGMNVPNPSENIQETTFVNAAKTICELNEKYRAISKQENKPIFSFEKGMGNALGETISTSNGSLKGIHLSEDDFSNLENLVSTMRRNRDNEQAMPFEDGQEERYVIAHEYGHALFNQILNKNEEYKKQIDNLTEQAIKSGDYYEIRDIQQKLRKLRNNALGDTVNKIKKIAQEDNPNERISFLMSTYGSTSPSEWLAEAFANSECGKPNAIGKAMSKYLKGVEE